MVALLYVRINDAVNELKLLGLRVADRPELVVAPPVATRLLNLARDGGFAPGDVQVDDGIGRGYRFSRPPGRGSRRRSSQG